MSIIHTLIEGTTDEAVAARLIVATGHEKGYTYGRHGWSYIKDRIAKYNEAARFEPYLALVDFMDTGLQCPGEVIQQWLPERHPDMLFRCVVREIESRLLADRSGFARLLHISPEFLPSEPEKLIDPKAEVIRLARRSKNKNVRETLIPKMGSTATVGPDYSFELIRFIQNDWNIEIARKNAPSLERCILRLKELAGRREGD